MDINSYLQRINYTGALTPAAATLKELQLAHLRAVPFENLSIHWGEPIVLTEAALCDKIVRRGRGGFCYELNGLFAALLRALGFKVTMLSAGVANDKGEFGPDFDHMALMVTLDERYLADVGFGDSFLAPLLLDERAEQRQGDKAYRIDAAGDRFILQQRGADGVWRAQYRFSLRPHVFADYAEMCRYHQTSPDSHFTRQRICSRATAEGRISLSERRLIRTRAGQRTEQELTGEEEYTQALREHFGIVPATDDRPTT